MIGPGFPGLQFFSASSSNIASGPSTENSSTRPPACGHSTARRLPELELDGLRVAVERHLAGSRLLGERATDRTT